MFRPSQTKNYGVVSIIIYIVTHWLNTLSRRSIYGPWCSKPHCIYIYTCIKPQNIAQIAESEEEKAIGESWHKALWWADMWMIDITGWRRSSSNTWTLFTLTSTSQLKMMMRRRMVWTSYIHTIKKEDGLLKFVVYHQKSESGIPGDSLTVLRFYAVWNVFCSNLFILFVS